MSELYDVAVNGSPTEHVPTYKVRSLCGFFPTQVFDNYDDAMVYYDKMVGIHEYDSISILESTESGWVEL